MASKNKNIFIELERENNSNKLLIKSEPDKSKIDPFLLAKQKLLSDIISFRDSYKWITRESSIKRIKMYHQTNFNPKKSTELLGESSKNAFETAMWYASDKFKKAIGVNTFRLLKEGNIVQAQREFDIATGNLDLTNLIAKPLVDMLPTQYPINPLNSPSDCILELKVLKQITNNVMHNVFAKLDPEKMALLLHILQSDDPLYIAQRSLIYEYLENDNMDTESLLYLLKDKEL